MDSLQWDLSMYDFNVIQFPYIWLEITLNVAYTHTEFKR